MMDSRPRLNEYAKDGTARKNEGAFVTTPMDSTSIALLGGFNHGSVCVTRDQEDRFRKIYGFTSRRGRTALENAGDIRNLMRYADIDGLRVMAFLSRYLEPGEDPVRLLQNALSDAGYDVSDMPDEDDG